MTPKEVSVVIPALNEAGRLEKSIESAWVNGAWHVIVCDGGSIDKSVEVAQRRDAHVVHSEPGRGRQLREGAKHADGSMLLFLHADSTLGEGCLEELCRRADLLDSGRPFWGGFRQRIDAKPILYRF